MTKLSLQKCYIFVDVAALQQMKAHAEQSKLYVSVKPWIKNNRDEETIETGCRICANPDWTAIRQPEKRDSYDPIDFKKLSHNSMLLSLPG